MTRILIRAGRTPFETFGPESVIQRNLIATNTGNLLFSDAVQRMLSVDGAEFTANRYRTGPDDADRINEEYDLFVVPLANAFRPTFMRHLRTLTATIRRLDIPVVVFGVGAQADMDYGTGALSAIDDDVRDFVSAVLDRSASIGVRGEFTESYLNRLGFKDVDVIGCPSMFWHGDRLPVEKSSPALEPDAALALNISFDSANIPGSEIRDGSGGSAIERIAAQAHRAYPDLVYVAQELKDLEVLFWGDVTEAAGTSAPGPLQRAHPLFQDDKVRLYYDTPRWLEALRDRDFAFGTRIHGNIAALLAGTPAMVLCHDSRTLELCRYFDIPHRPLSEAGPDTDPARLYEETDLGPLVSGHRERFERIVAFMDRNGLDHVFGEGGDHGAGFDKRLAGVAHHPGVGVWDGGDDGRLGYRFAWLRQRSQEAKERQGAADRRLRSLEKRLESLEKANTELRKRSEKDGKRIERLQREVRATPYRRLRRLAGRILRRLGLRR